MPGGPGHRPDDAQAMAAHQQSSFDCFLERLDVLKSGYRTGTFRSRRYGLTVKRSVDAHRTTVYSEALDGSDVISFNLYLTRDTGPVLRPCEMSSEKVMRFVLEFVADVNEPS